MDISLTKELETFRKEVRDFLEKNLTEKIKRDTALNVAALFEPDVSRPWHQILYQKGWAAPGWPVEYGGLGWSSAQQYIWRMESWRAGAPVISQLGMRLVAPVLFNVGTQQQKDYFLPKLLSGEHYWCQGFSEPGAGSDLAALKCKATDNGDHYIVNGTKLWQTHAHHANWMITLVRTENGPKPQDGITCLLIDMNDPNISISPITTIGGDHEVNQVFLDDVKVPKENRIGEEGLAWSITKHILSEERKSAGNAIGRLRYNFNAVIRMMDRHPDAWDNPDVCTRLGEIAADIDTIEILELKLLLNSSDEDHSEVGPSTIKLRASLLEQSVAELAIKVVGEESLEWIVDRPLHNLSGGLEDLEKYAVVPRHLNARARTIFGGATEVQLEIIAKSLYK